MKPGDFPLGSVESRAAARVQFGKVERDPGTVIRVNIVHIGGDLKESCPAPQRSKWEGGVTQFVHVGEDEI